MIITFGSGFYGKIASVNNQWIETKFFGIMFVPLFPLSSMFVTGSEFRSRRGMEIPLNNKSIAATYARLFSFLIAAWFIYMTAASNENTSIIKFLILSIIFFSAWIYFCFFYGRATGADYILRMKMGVITGLYVMPQWLDYMQIKNMLSDFEHIYKSKYPDHYWKADLQNDKTDPEKFPLLFAIALFNCMVYDLPENDELYIKADALFELKPLNTQNPAPQLSV